MTDSLRRDIVHALIAAAALGSISTLGDFVWQSLNLRHRVIYGLAHGAILCLCIGFAVGIRERRPLAGALAGPLVGLLAAGGFYLLAPWLRWGAMFPMWMLFWLCFALLQARLRRDSRLQPAIARGLIAALLSGAAFYLISGIWTRPPPGGPDYLRHLWSWTFAFLPGFLALFVGGSRERTFEQ